MDNETGRRCEQEKVCDWKPGFQSDIIQVRKVNNYGVVYIRGEDRPWKIIDRRTGRTVGSSRSEEMAWKSAAYRDEADRNDRFSRFVKEDYGPKTNDGGGM